MNGFLDRRRDSDANPFLFFFMFSSGELDVPAVFCQFLRSCGGEGNLLALFKLGSKGKEGEDIPDQRRRRVRCP